MSNGQVLATKEVTNLWNKNYICIMIANTLLCFGTFTVNPLVASYTKYLGTSDTMTGLLAGMFFGIAFAIRPISGPMVTKMDKRILLILTFIVGCVAAAGYALFDGVAAFAIFRFLNGLEYSFLGTLIMTLASDNIPTERMASGMGIYTIGQAIATAVSPAIAESMLRLGTDIKNERLGFTIVFLFAAAAHAIAIIPAALLSSDKKTKDELASTGAWYTNIVTIHAIPIAIVILLLQIPYSLFNTYMIEFGKERGIAGISAFFTVLAIMLVVTRPASGVLTDRLGIKKIAIPGFIVLALAFLVVGSSTALWMVLVGAALAAVGVSATQPPLIAMSILIVPALKRGVASNTIYMGIDLGLFIGPLFGGFIHEMSDYSSVFKAAIIPTMLAMVALLAILPGFKRRRAELEAEIK